ncbi:hypothetical protein A3I50_04440 [Candidatus Roizmanbacteria bacterium RIFCSPLOWO2_02_FULL_37_9]|nr:MAG: hypothetical protein A3I50_04440 [Candidatus Roizmanbacteria bacterium RIFCSPLOWO2_02_FULL_37_9]
MHDRKTIPLADDDRDTIKTLIWMRIPPLVVGSILGFILSFATSRFEEVLSKRVEIAFFIPFVVYMADAVGTQTQTIFIRDLSRGTAKFSNYLLKETILGIILGLFFGLLSWIVVSLWFNSARLATAVGLATFTAIGTAPFVAILITKALQLEHQDPAVGAGPIATVIQDTISVVLYGLIASAILLS